MIQRIQSLYLSLTILLSLLFLKGSFITFTDTSEFVIKITFSGLVSAGVLDSDPIEKLLPLSGLIIIIPIVSLITILLFRNRKIQLWLSLIGIILSTGLIFISIYYTYIICIKYGTSVTPGLKMIIPLLILIFYLLAYRGIRKDDRLIKSYDRLR